MFARDDYFTDTTLQDLLYPWRVASRIVASAIHPIQHLEIGVYISYASSANTPRHYRTQSDQELDWSEIDEALVNASGHPRVTIKYLSHCNNLRSDQPNVYTHDILEHERVRLRADFPALTARDRLVFCSVGRLAWTSSKEVKAHPPPDIGSRILPRLVNWIGDAA